MPHVASLFERSRSRESAANEVERLGLQGTSVTALLEQLDEEIEQFERMLGNEALPSLVWMWRTAMR